MTSFDVAIIGAGPGGYNAAAAAAKEGLSVVLFEKDQLGGTCLNRGCIPTKSLLHSAQVYHSAKNSQHLGVHAQGATYDFAAMHAHKDDVVDSLKRGINKLMSSSRVKVVQGTAQVTGPGTIVCGEETYEATDIIVATGSLPSIPPIPGRELPGVYTSDDLLEGGGVQAESIVIIGGGVIGVEVAGIYAALGSSVTIIEALPRILPLMDKDISARVASELRSHEVNVQPKGNVCGIETDSFGKLVVSFEGKGGEYKQVRTRCVLIATGRHANTEGLFAPGCEPAMERGAIVADEAGRTSIEHLYVIGDAKAGNVQLAHVAEAQAKNVVAAIVGKEAPVDVNLVPNCVYTSPEVASVGLTEAEAKQAGVPVKTMKYLAGANGKCRIEDCSSGYIKLVANKETGVLLGAQLVYPRSTDLVSELTLAIKYGLTAEQVAAVIHPHPTFGEGIMVACAK